MKVILFINEDTSFLQQYKKYLAKIEAVHEEIKSMDPKDYPRHAPSNVRFHFGVTYKSDKDYHNDPGFYDKFYESVKEHELKPFFQITNFQPNEYRAVWYKLQDKVEVRLIKENFRSELSDYIARKYNYNRTLATYISANLFEMFLNEEFSSETFLKIVQNYAD